LRDGATRLLALAVEARKDGKIHLAAEITKLASEAHDQAVEMDCRAAQAADRQLVRAPT
jgi:hypothetical protein